MPSRKYEGDPLDMTWQDFKDRPYKGPGETVYATGSEEGTVTTEGVPDLGGDDGEQSQNVQYTEGQFIDAIQDILSKGLLITSRRVAERVGCTMETARQYLVEQHKLGLLERDKIGASAVAYLVPGQPPEPKKASPDDDTGSSAARLTPPRVARILAMNGWAAERAAVMALNNRCGSVDGVFRFIDSLPDADKEEYMVVLSDVEDWFREGGEQP